MLNLTGMSSKIFNYSNNNSNSDISNSDNSKSDILNSEKSFGQTVTVTHTSPFLGHLRQGHVLQVRLGLETGHRGVCCNPCNWDGRYWMPTMVGDP